MRTTSACLMLAWVLASAPVDYAEAQIGIPRSKEDAAANVVDSLPYAAPGLYRMLSARDKVGLRALSDGLRQGDTILEYGNWYGPGWWGGDRDPDKAGSKPPVDELDAAAQRHDFGYLVAERMGKIYGKSEELRLKAIADAIAVRDALRMDPDPSKWNPPAADPAKAARYRDRFITGFTYESKAYDGVSKLGNAANWVTSPLQTWEMSKTGQHLNEEDFEKQVERFVNNWNKTHVPDSGGGASWEEEKADSGPESSTGTDTSGGSSGTFGDDTATGGDAKTDTASGGSSGTFGDDKAGSGAASDQAGGTGSDQKDDAGSSAGTDVASAGDAGDVTTSDTPDQADDKPDDKTPAPPVATTSGKKDSAGGDVSPDAGQGGDTDDMGATGDADPAQSGGGLVIGPPSDDSGVDYTPGDYVVDDKGDEYKKTGTGWVPTGENYGAIDQATKDQWNKDIQSAADQLKGEEASSSGSDGSDFAGGGQPSALDVFGNQKEADWQTQKSGAYTTMGFASQLGEAGQAGDQQAKDAKQMVSAAGRDAQQIKSDAAAKAAQKQKDLGWGKAIGDAIESGVKQGGEAFGSTLGEAAAGKLTSQIFGDPKQDSDPSGGGMDVASAGGAAAGGKPASGGGGGGGGSGGAPVSAVPGDAAPASVPDGDGAGAGEGTGGETAADPSEGDASTGGDAPIVPQTQVSGSFTAKLVPSGRSYRIEVTGISTNNLSATVRGTDGYNASFGGVGSISSSTIPAGNSGVNDTVTAKDLNTGETATFNFTF